MNKELFVARLKDARERKNITLKDLADRCGISLSAMNRYVGMSTVPTVEVAISIAQVLEVSLDWLCGLRDYENSNNSMTTGKIIRTISALLTTPTIESQENQYAAKFGEYTNGNTYINIDQSRIPESIDFASWGKFMELYKNGTIDDDMYNAWIEKKAKELDGVLLPVKPPFTAVETDELPF